MRGSPGINGRGLDVCRLPVNLKHVSHPPVCIRPSGTTDRLDTGLPRYGGYIDPAIAIREDVVLRAWVKGTDVFVS